MDDNPKRLYNKRFTYPKSSRSLVMGQRHYEIDTDKLPSVTTIISQTQDKEKQEALAAWKAKVGENEAERVKNVAASRGTAMHSILEHYLEKNNILDLTETGQEAHKMANKIIEEGFPDLQEIWGSEVTVYYPGLYAGATDLVGIYMGRDSIIDFKQSNKPKKAEWITDYKLQMVAYAMAHNYVYRTDIDQGVILMCTPDLFFQRFIINGREFRELKLEWLKRIDAFYATREASN